MILIWELHVTRVYLQTAFQLNLAQFLLLRQKNKKECGDQDAHFWDAFSTIFSHTHHCNNNASFVHGITLISIHCSCTLPVLLQNMSWCRILEYHSYHKISDTINNHLWVFDFRWLAQQLSLLSFQADHWLSPWLSVPPTRRQSLAHNSALLCSWSIPQSSPWAVVETGSPST